MSGWIECAWCGDPIHEGERAYRIDGKLNCKVCAFEYFEDEYGERVDHDDCAEAQERRDEMALGELIDMRYEQERDRAI